MTNVHVDFRLTVGAEELKKQIDAINESNLNEDTKNGLHHLLGNILDKIEEETMCHVCKGAGALIMYNEAENKHEIQKCDLCDKFSSDARAWQSLCPLTSSQYAEYIIEDLKASVAKKLKKEYGD